MPYSNSIYELFQLSEVEKAGLPIGELEETFDSIPRYKSYEAISHFEAQLHKQLGAHNELIHECVARVVLVEAIENNQWRPTCKVSEAVRAEVRIQLARIQEFLLTKPPGYYKPGSDNFRKDAGLIRGALLPLGPGVVDTDSLVWRRPLKVSTIAQRLRFIRFYLRIPRGFGPVFQAHTHTEMLGKFTEIGWREAYRLIGELLEINPGYKGFCRASWFCDPAVKLISPRLSYIVQEPGSAGAFVCYLGLDQSGSALAKSNTRRELYAKGEYVPKSYMLIWHRKGLLAWCKKVI